jgi:hypothetical protein
MQRPVLVYLTAAAVVFAGRPAFGLDLAERRGDFWYDTAGRFAGVEQGDFPASFERRPMSHREKFELRGVLLPDRVGPLTPRWVAPKPARVEDGEGQMSDRIVVKFIDDVTVRLREGKLTANGGSVAPVEEILARYPEAQVQRLFSTEERILDEDKETGEAISGKQLADLNNYYLIRRPEPGPAGIDLANALLPLEVIETAYLMGKAEAPVCSDIAPTTPLWEDNQFYLDPAPAGVDADFAWAYHAGGDGAGPDFSVIDCEWGWCLTHEDLDIEASDVINGLSGGSDPNHGTAVLGEIGACDNDYGVTGITPDVALKMSDFDSEPSWAANIATAAAFASAGEIVLLEIHVPGPDTGDPCPCNCGQFEFVPVEWGQASFDAIETATANGVIVVEAGGNGSVNLDDGVYGGKFNLLVRDSGAIIVGAGMPVSHSPECWTNHGRRIDCHGYGSQVYTAGYGGLFNQSGCSQDYTATFSGTSSASPIIVGVCASLQGIANEKLGLDVSPTAMRDLIKVGGTPQGPPTAKIIRALPDLSQAIPALDLPTAAPRRTAATATVALASPRPNPFRVGTVIRYDVPRDGSDVVVTVHDPAGRRVATLADGRQPAGRYFVEWDGLDSTGRAVSAGVYFVRLETGGEVETRKIARIR